MKQSLIFNEGCRDVIENLLCRCVSVRKCRTLNIADRHKDKTLINLLGTHAAPGARDALQTLS